MYPFDYLPAPLTAHEFYILLALSHEESYAYGLRSRVMNASLGSVSIPGGTLYPLLTRLHDQGFIDILGKRTDGTSGVSRQYYGISEEGLIRLQEELRRLKHPVRIGERAGLLENDVPADIQRLMLDVRRGEV